MHMSDLEFEYYTDFKLVCPVNDFEAARDYLIKDDMTKYLIGSFDKKGMETLKPEDIVSIKWKLLDDQKGKIILITTRELTAVESKAISDWIKGQNSDGLGECFEQQDFAENKDCYDNYDEDYEDDEDDCYYCSNNYYCGDDYYIFASFDWRTNNYKLHLNL